MNPIHNRKKYAQRRVKLYNPVSPFLARRLFQRFRTVFIVLRAVTIVPCLVSLHSGYIYYCTGASKHVPAAGGLPKSIQSGYSDLYMRQAIVPVFIIDITIDCLLQGCRKPRPKMKKEQEKCQRPTFSGRTGWWRRTPSTRRGSGRRKWTSTGTSRRPRTRTNTTRTA